MPLCDRTLRTMLAQGLLIAPEAHDDDPDNDEDLVNPASIDIRIGRRLLAERAPRDPTQPVVWIPVDLRRDRPYWLQPKEFVLVETLERFRIPNGYSMHLYLKSSSARSGFDHSLAFWFDPGWDGIGTLELTNNLRFHALPVYLGTKIGQIVIEQNDGLSDRPYAGRYQGAQAVEGAKPSEPTCPPSHDALREALGRLSNDVDALVRGDARVLLRDRVELCYAALAAPDDHARLKAAYTRMREDFDAYVRIHPPENASTGDLASSPT